MRKNSNKPVRYALVIKAKRTSLNLGKKIPLRDKNKDENQGKKKKD